MRYLLIALLSLSLVAGCKEEKKPAEKAAASAVKKVEEGAEGAAKKVEETAKEVEKKAE